MTIANRTGLAGFFVSTLFVLSACGGSSTTILDNGSEGLNSAGQQVQNDESVNDDGRADGADTLTVNDSVENGTPVVVGNTDSNNSDVLNNAETPVVTEVDNTPSASDDDQSNASDAGQTPSQPANDDPAVSYTHLTLPTNREV